MNYLVSIVITCYNYGEFITQALASVQKQTYSNFEVIVIDDGSTDDSEQKILPFLQDSKFTYIKQKNSGQAFAKNRGIEASKGDLIAFLDADDIWKFDKLEKQVPLFDHSKVGVVYSRSCYIDEHCTELPRLNDEKYLQPQIGNITEHLVYNNFIPFSSAIVRRECFDKLGEFDTSISMGIDWDLWLRFSTQFKFDYYDEKLLLYRVGHIGQMSKNIIKRFSCAEKIIEKFYKNFPDYISESIMKDAAYYSFCLRAYALRRYGLQHSYQNYLKAIALYPLRKQAYIGFMKVPIRAIFGN